MDSESNRRVLATKTYISYGALKPGSTPCSHKGASYYNCRLGAQANPYYRSCNRVTRCGRGG
ncbi:rapid alkalinization factor [Phtheirospermum japonicum]|uniref:Rapid alkalinization factor n=1 Tax=Phtheirospermum japonicum TaxID=374723 RepID=A0A830BLV8_9LAMI|nr:rapid alkalinization factor [Phtheirospermum japonicum]